MSQTSEKPALDLSPDTDFFDEDTYQAAVEQLTPYFRVGGGLFVELSAEAEAKVALEFTLATLSSIPPKLIASVLYDVLKTRFLQLREGQRTKFTFLFREDSYERSVYAEVETSSSEDLEAALSTIRDVALEATEGQILQFDNENRQWKNRQK